VIKDDLSRWLNTKPIDLFVVSTRAELASIAADGTPYVFTDKETRKTGLPRFDRLLAKGREYAPDDRDVVIVAPTWRAYLALPDRAATGQGQVDDPFWESAYFRNWIALLRSPEIAEAAERRGLRIAFMPHPNMQPILEHMDLPSSVQPLTFADNDVQELYARCALLVTDYSSVAFDVALLSVPVVYFQFDYDEMMRGGHTARPGYFDYVRDGFGPVATDVTGAVAAIVSSIEAGPRPSDKYQARIDLTFEDRDGRACARVVAAVEELGRPYHASGEDVTRVSSTAHHMGRST
jgi:CDP-glycerol glycerophosphotransferase (TagB/SpsB family)